MTLIVSGVARFALNGRIFDRPWANVLDFQLDTTGTFVNRADACFACAGNIINSWAEHLQPEIVDDCVLDSVSWVDLDSSGGSTGSRSATSQHTLPLAGAGSSDPSSGNVAVLVTKETVSARGQRSGRYYMPGVQESGTNGNQLTSTRLAALQTAFDDYLNELNDEPVLPTNFDRSLVVVHTTGPNPTTGTFTPVTSLNVSARLATQRRRLRA